MTITPYWFQQEAIDAFPAYFRQRRGNPVFALPTGTGKSVIIGYTVKNALQAWPHTRLIVSMKSEELLVQNLERLLQIWPNAPVGVHSASLNRRDTTQPIIYGNIGSMFRSPEIFGVRHLMLIDEAHEASPTDTTMYSKFIQGLKARTPEFKFAGYTATKYRQGLGLIYDEGGLFDDLAYDLTTLEGFNTLLSQGFIAPLIPKNPSIEIDLSKVAIASTGDYNQEQLEREAEKITFQALQETYRLAQGRHSWLVFCSGIHHALMTRDILNSMGVPATTVHSTTKEFTMSQKERRENLDLFKAGHYTAMTNNGVLTTGFDHKPIDLIVMLRATTSTSLWVQMLGRGTRVFGGDRFFPPKYNCLALDFAGNTMRLGPINDPVLPHRKGKGNGEAPVKLCPACGVYNHPTTRFCVGCGMEFEFRPKIKQEAATLELIRDAPLAPPPPPPQPIIEMFHVNRVYYYSAKTKNKPLPWLQVDYHCHGRVKPIRENIFLEHSGFPGKRAREWWRTRLAGEPPDTVERALTLTDNLRVPTRIHVDVAPKYPEVLRYEYN